ncbi:hypothetical protein CFC21_095261 [Triticum aestivum]|uniref:TF-B3 domain-containing protein n=2 Tax=Triticum aestivum TaxID=4565 RepID=A0A3B6R771_WHEAT|nr:hypothetical protein CFC21_095261 [Triticum aestivum]
MRVLGLRRLTAGCVLVPPQPDNDRFHGEIARIRASLPEEVRGHPEYTANNHMQWAAYFQCRHEEQLASTNNGPVRGVHNTDSHRPWWGVPGCTLHSVLKHLEGGNEPPFEYPATPELDGDQCKRIVQSRCMESSDVQGTSSLPDRVKDEQMETPLCPSKQLPDAHPIKPKVEPCENSLSPAPDASEDCETTPLSCNHPFFTVILSRSHVQKPFQLYIPGRFHKHLPEERTSATLICRGRSWAMRYCGDLKTKRLDADWMDFAVDNRLQVSDACVFELVTGTREEVVFQVQILRGGLPKDITSKGYTADEPLVIVG